MVTNDTFYRKTKNFVIKSLEVLEDIKDRESIPLGHPQEEYSIEEINVYTNYILKEIPIINSEREFELKIIKDYKDNKLDVINNKCSSMNYHAKKHEKKNSAKIYNVLKKYFI